MPEPMILSMSAPRSQQDEELLHSSLSFKMSFKGVFRRGSAPLVPRGAPHSLKEGCWGYG